MRWVSRLIVAIQTGRFFAFGLIQDLLRLGVREQRLYAGHRKECGYLNGVSMPDPFGSGAGKRERPSRENE
jgi:hypothetical protein